MAIAIFLIALSVILAPYFPWALVVTLPLAALFIVS